MTRVIRNHWRSRREMIVLWKMEQKAISWSVEPQKLTFWPPVLSFFNRCGLLKRRFFVPLLTSEVLNTQHVNKTDNYNLFHMIENNFHVLSWFREGLSQYVTYFTVTKVHTYLVDITHGMYVNVLSILENQGWKDGDRERK